MLTLIILHDMVIRMPFHRLTRLEPSFEKTSSIRKAQLTFSLQLYIINRCCSISYLSQSLTAKPKKIESLICSHTPISISLIIRSPLSVLPSVYALNSLLYKLSSTTSPLHPPWSFILYFLTWFDRFSLTLSWLLRKL